MNILRKATDIFWGRKQPNSLWNYGYGVAIGHDSAWCHVGNKRTQLSNSQAAVAKYWAKHGTCCCGLRAGHEAFVSHLLSMKGRELQEHVILAAMASEGD